MNEEILTKKDREEYGRLAKIVQNRINTGRATFGDRALLKHYQKKAAGLA